MDLGFDPNNSVGSFWCIQLRTIFEPQHDKTNKSGGWVR